MLAHICECVCFDTEKSFEEAIKFRKDTRTRFLSASWPKLISLITFIVKRKGNVSDKIPEINFSLLC